MPVFGNVRDAASLALVRVEAVDRLAIEPHIAARRWPQTGKYFDELCLAVAFDAGDAEGFAATHFKRDVIKRRAARVSRDFRRIAGDTRRK